MYNIILISAKFKNYIVGQAGYAITNSKIKWDGYIFSIISLVILETVYDRNNK